MFQFRVKRTNVDACDNYFRRVAHETEHVSASGSKLHEDKDAAREYIWQIGNILQLNNSNDWDRFVNTLYVHMSTYGGNITEFKHLEYRVGSKNGTAKYALVATKVNQQHQVVVCYACHHIDERILENQSFNKNTADMTLDWLRAQSCRTLEAFMSPNEAPALIFE